MGFFIDPSSLSDNIYGHAQVVFLGLVYGQILHRANCKISSGTELLLLVPSIAGVIGSVVLPILGAVPDGLMVLFSGLGSNAQYEVSVGIGALAGSTIMLLTIPYCLSIIGGRVNYNKNYNAAVSGPGNNNDNNINRTSADIVHGRDVRYLNYKKPKLYPPKYISLTKTGVAGSKLVATNGRIMLMTTAGYVIMQVPTLLLGSYSGNKKAFFERWFALAGMSTCFAGFIWYLYNQLKLNASGEDEQRAFQSNEMRVKAIRDRSLSLRGCMRSLLLMNKDNSNLMYTHSPSLLTNKLNIPLVVSSIPSKTKQQMKELCRPFFQCLDYDGNGKLDIEELREMLLLLNEKPTEEELKKLFNDIDIDRSGYVDFEEFIHCLILFVLTKPEMLGPESPTSYYLHASLEQAEDSDEQEEVPEDLCGLPASEQQYRIKCRAFKMIAAGTFLVLVFSDPMVKVFSDLGRRSGISSFYISFVLAPLASNACELVSSYSYALKKTKKSISISFSALEGATCMNNTFCLGIFLSLVYFKSIIWRFTAETITILFVQVSMTIISQNKVHLVCDGLIALALYPVSLVLVYVLENVVGCD